MSQCITCGDELHPERAGKYAYCTKQDCQKQNFLGLTMMSVGVNKSADQFQILDDHTREELASGKYHDPRRGSHGPPPRAPATTATNQPARESAPRSTTTPGPSTKRAPNLNLRRRPGTTPQQRLAVLYNEQGLRPDEIAQKLGLSRYAVTQLILTAPRHR